MTFPEYNGFSLNDANTTGVIASNVNIKSAPARQIETESVSRRSGVRVLNTEFGPRQVHIEGYILGSNSADLRDKIDAFNTNVTSQREGLLAVDVDRSATALVERLSIQENPYNTDYVPYSVDFLLPNPFFYEGQHSAIFVLASGETSVTQLVTFSGSYYGLPVITVNPTSGTGVTATTRIDLTYDSTGETITWSGASGEENLNYGDNLQFDFDSQLITRSSVIEDSTGAYADFYPGQRNITITFSGAGDWVGGTATISYQPRYL